MALDSGWGDNGALEFAELIGHDLREWRGILWDKRWLNYQSNY